MHIDRQVGLVLTECDTHLLIVKHTLNQLQKDGVRLQASCDGISTCHSSHAIIQLLLSIKSAVCGIYVDGV